MNTVTVYAKTLAGDLYPLEVNPRISLERLMDAIHQSLPASIQPRHAYQVVLVEYHETKRMGEMLELSPEQILPILIHAHSYYDVELNWMSRASDMDDDADVQYELWQLIVRYSDNSPLLTKYFYTIPFHLQRKIERKAKEYPILPRESMRRVAREADGGEAFQLPAHSGNRISPHSIVQEELLHDLLGVLHPSAYYSLEYFLKEDWREIQIDAEQEQEEQEQEEQEQE